MEIGYSYHIKDCFFEMVQDGGLMSNKEGGGYRPHYFCLRDRYNPSMYWAVPISSKVDKYRTVMEHKMQTRGRCDTIVIGRFSGRACAFLIQNMFPITENYIDHVHTDNGVPVVLARQLQEDIEMKVNRVLNIRKKVPSILFPNVDRIMRILHENGDA